MTKKKIHPCKTKVGLILREQRKTANISARELAKTIGVSQGYLNSVELGYHLPGPDILEKICKGLKLDFELMAKLCIKERTKAGKTNRYQGRPMPTKNAADDAHNWHQVLGSQIESKLEEKDKPAYMYNQLQFKLAIIEQKVVSNHEILAIMAHKLEDIYIRIDALALGIQQNKKRGWFGFKKS